MTKITIDRSVVEQALEALEMGQELWITYNSGLRSPRFDAGIAALRVALSEPAVDSTAEDARAQGLRYGAQWEQRQEISWQPSSPYNPKRIGWELERTALGDGYYGSAIRAAMDFDCVTPVDMTVLQRYAAGVQKGTDHIRLQEIAMKVYHTALEQSQEPEPYDQTALDLCHECGWKAVVPGDGCLNCQRTEPVQESENIKAAFEAWVKSDSTLPITRDEHGYTDFTTALLWHAWQAAKTNAPEGASEGESSANAGLGLAGRDDTCEHDFAIAPRSGIPICAKCGLSETAARKQRTEPVQEQEPVAWSDAKLRGIASDYFPDARDWPAAMLCLRHLLMEQEKYPAPQPAPQPAALNWEPLQDFWRDNPAVDWDELEAAVIAAYQAKRGEQK
jgi:hypothetical protein